MRILFKIVYFSHTTSYNIGKIYFRYVRPHISIASLIFSLIWQRQSSSVLQLSTICVAASAAVVNAAAAAAAAAAAVALAADTDKAMRIYFFIDQSNLSC